jgi:hypothetical protein
LQVYFCKKITFVEKQGKTMEKDTKIQKIRQLLSEANTEIAVEETRSKKAKATPQMQGGSADRSSE